MARFWWSVRACAGHEHSKPSDSHDEVGYHQIDLFSQKLFLACLPFSASNPGARRSAENLADGANLGSAQSVESAMGKILGVRWGAVSSSASGSCTVGRNTENSCPVRRDSTCTNPPCCLTVHIHGQA